jgi:predicted lipid carrier protein YhbT
MIPTQLPAPPLSPVLLAGMALRPLPGVLLQPALSAAMGAIVRLHPGLFERLAGLDDSSFLIDPIDLPFALVLVADARRPRLRVAGDGDAAACAARVRGPLLALLDLLEGRIDGDALFFSRHLSIDGDTEAVVALRNAVDGAEIDLMRDIARTFGPLSAAAGRAAGLLGAVFARAAADLETLRAAAMAPLARAALAQAARLDALEADVAALARRRRRAAP